MSAPFGKNALTFSDVVTQLRTTFETFSDRQTGKNTNYTMTDAGLSAFSVFFMQSPSFLDFQRTMQETQGKSNAQTLFNVFQIPTDNHIRSLLDPVEPASVYPMFDFLFDGFQRAGVIESNNTLKTKGYHFEHNFGHGEQFLSSLLATLILLAYLLHTLLDFMDDKFCLLRQKLPSRRRLFDDMKALTTYFCFDSWEHLLDFMLDGWTYTPKSRIVRPPKPEIG